ncbi:hypothetical protein Taro_041017 [Colocasia esculenta]|uniref:CCHC-type domain-containing protein n=1 Tax=Colocasia esculenta TaxID=4460 RepID=A0A843WAE2_COLES|nr:hypothetical protein [Colocasia esculenta]
MSLEKLIGSLMAHEINMERLGESSSRKKHSNALKAEEDLSEEFSDNNESNKDDEDEEAMLSRRLQRILAKKKKYQSSRRYFKKNKDFKKTEGKDQKKAEPTCYECKKPRHMRAECSKLKKSEFRKKESSRKPRRFKKKAMAAAWDNSSDSDSESSSSNEVEEANLALMANTEEKADSDLMFWAIQNQEINTVEIIIERMKFASSQVWDKKSKLNVSLPYAHLLTKVFQDYGISVVGDVSEKMGQAIRSRNLRKSGFSLVNGLWTKTSMAEGEAIIGQPQEVQEERSKPHTIVASILRDVLESISSTQGEPERFSELVAPEAVASGHTDEIIMEEAPSQGEQAVAHEKISVEDASIEGEQSIDEEAAPQGQHTKSVPMDNEEHVEFEEPIARAHSKRKRVAHKKPKEKQLNIQLKPVISRLNEQGKSLTSLQSDIQSILISQTSAASEIGALSTEVHSLRDDFKMFMQLCRWMKGEFDSVKKLISSREQSTSAPPARSPAEPVSNAGPLGPRPVEETTGPSGPTPVEESAGPSGPIVVEPAGSSGPPEVVVGPPGPMISEDVSPRVEEPTAAPKAHETSSLETPAPPSPPSSSTAPPAPITFKQPMPRTISSPTPFPSQSTSPPASSTSILPPLISEDPVASSSLGASSSSVPCLDGPSISPFSTHQTFLHPPTPPSFVTFIPEGAQLEGPFLEKFEDELEISNIHSVLSVASHVHRTDSSSPVSKKRKLSTALALPTEPKFPPLWFSLTIENRRKPLYREYLQKCILATIFGVTFLNLTNHLNVVLPYNHFSKADQSKIFKMAKCKSEDQWAKGHSALYRKYLLAKSDRFPPRDSPLTLSEWSVIHHKSLWAPFHSKGSEAHQRLARVMGRISAQQGRLPSFQRFIFREFHLGHISSEVLAPLLSECERLSPTDWEKHYNQSALQLEALNSSLFKAGKPTLTAEAFLDLNSINLVQDSYLQWVERYKLFLALKQDLMQHKLFYPIKINQFLQFSSFGSFSTYKLSLGTDEYGNFLSTQRQLHIQRMLPDMGPSYAISSGAF